MRELLADTSEAASLARTQYALRIAQAIAAMATSLGGVDAIVFSGGIGDGAAPVRAAVAECLAWMGLRLDPEANAAGDARIDAEGTAIPVFVIRVDEERELATAVLADWPLNGAVG